MNHNNAQGNMALASPKVIFRGDPQEGLRAGRSHYCSSVTGLGPNATKGAVTLEELYVVDAGKAGAAVLLRRQDVNGRAGHGFLSGYDVPMATWLRVQNGKIIEWFDDPINKISAAALPFKIPAQGPNTPIQSFCMPYVEGTSTDNASVNTDTSALPFSLDYLYGTDKPEYFYNPFEESAARAVRSFIAAWHPNDALPLGAFVDANVVFRTDPTATQLSHGRNNLLRQICGSIIGTRKMRDLFVVGGDYDTSVLASWDQTEARGRVTRGASFFRVQNGLIFEWLDMPDSGVAPAATHTAACQAVNSALGAG